MPNFYEIIHPKTKQKSYLFGTVHSRSVRSNTLPPQVFRALKNSQAVFIEHKKDTLDHHVPQLNAKYQQAHQEWLLRPDNQERYMQLLEKLLPDQDEATRLAFFHTPFYERQHQLLETMGLYESNLCIDESIFLYGQDNGKKTGYLETISFEELEDILIGEGGYEAAADYAYDYLYYLSQNPQYSAFEEIEELYFSQDPLKPDLNIGHYDGTFIISQRNQRFFDNMRTPIKHGNAFFAVGTFHLPGLTEKLRAAGYTVKPIITTERTKYLPIHCKQPVSTDKELLLSQRLATKEILTDAICGVNGSWNSTIASIATLGAFFISAQSKKAKLLEMMTKNAHQMNDPESLKQIIKQLDTHRGFGHYDSKHPDTTSFTELKRMVENYSGHPSFIAPLREAIQSYSQDKQAISCTSRMSACI